MTTTVREMADRVQELRKAAWEKTDPRPAILVTENLTPDDLRVVRKVVADAGFTGAEAEEMVRRVSARVVGQVEALADNIPADGGD
jgi:hypothetical protein